MTADFDTVGPAGKTYDQTKVLRIWVGHPPPPGYGLELSEGGYGLVFEDKDALDAYVVNATVIDHVSGVVLHTTETLNIVAK